jgi:hypothetical protein
VSTPDGGPEPGSYNVTISGAAGGRSFERTGTVRVLGTVASVGTTNGVNPVDVCLVSGFPAAQPEPGAIWYGSNSACVPWASAAHLDLGYVTVDGATVTVEPDARIAATGGNNYTAYGGLAACPYFPVSGRMSVTFRDDGTVTGSIDVVGYGAGCGNTNYQARINGERS